MIVAAGADDCGNRRAVPTAVFDRTILVAQRTIDIRLRYPIAGIGRVRIAPVAVVGIEGFGYEVVSLNKSTRKPRVRPVTGIDHGDHDIGAPGRNVPGGKSTDSGRAVAEIRLPVDVRVVGNECRLEPAVRLRIFDIGMGRELGGNRPRFAQRDRAIERHDVRLHGHLPYIGKRSASVGGQQ